MPIADVAHPQRHAIVSIHAAAVDTIPCPAARAWIAQGRPLIARRRTEADPEGEIALGLPLPPANGKARIALSVAREKVAGVAPPPLLSDAARHAPQAWAADVKRLIALDPAVRVYGSLCWEHLTGLPYLGAASDLDLLWGWRPDIDDLLAGLTMLAPTLAMRLDGEVVMPDGAGIAWREFASDADPVLAKAVWRSGLIARAALAHAW